MTVEPGDVVKVTRHPSRRVNGRTGRVVSVGAYVGERGRLVSVQLDVPNPDEEVASDVNSWLLYEDEIEKVD